MIKTLKDLAQEAGLSYYTIYYWLKIGLLKESGRVGKQRVFDDEEYKLFKKVVDMRKQGYELSAIKKMLKR